LKIRYALLTVMLGLTLGALTGVMGAAALLGALAFAAAVALFTTKPHISVCFLACYGVADWIIRLVAPGALSSLWDELYLIGLVLLQIYKRIAYRNTEGFKTSPLDMPLIIYIAVMLGVLIINCTDYAIGIEGFRAIIQYTLWYFIVLQLIDDEKAIKAVAVTFVICSGILAIYGVLQFIIGVEMPEGWVDQNEAGVRTRVFAIFTSPNIFGSLLTLATPIAVSLMLTAKKTKGKAIYAFLAFMMVCSLVFTFSRGAWIGFALAAFIYIILKDKRLLLPFIAAAVILALCVPSVTNRITYMLSPEYIESSLKGGRLIRWQTGLRMINTYPILGVGLGNFGGAVAMNHKMRILVDGSYEKTFYMDNYFLKTAVESGIVGFTSFVVLMYSVFINGVRTIALADDKLKKELSIGITAGLSGIIIHNLVENIFETPLMASLFWIFAALLINIRLLEDKK